MKKFGIALGFLALVIALSFMVPLPRVAGQQNVNFQIANYVGSVDPCYNPYGTTRSSVPLNITSATTTQLVAAVAGQAVYVCTGEFTMTGTTPTIAFEYGTGSNCGTGTTVLTGAFAPTAGQEAFLGESGPAQFKTPAGNALCAVTTGTPGIQGYLLVAQQ